MNSTSNIVLDLGTTSIKTSTLSSAGEFIECQSTAAPRLTFDELKVRGNAQDYCDTALRLLKRSYSKKNTQQTLSITSQRSSFVIWSTKSGEALSPLISWQDRSIENTQFLTNEQSEQLTQITGLVPSPYYLAFKLSEYLQSHPEIKRDEIKRDEIKVGTMDTWVIWQLSHGRHHIMDKSMAARTALFNIHHEDWSTELLELFNVSPSMLPNLISSTPKNIELSQQWQLGSLIADQSASLVALSNKPNTININIGTGAFVLKKIKADAQPIKGYQHALLYNDGTSHFGLEGAINGLSRSLEILNIEYDSSPIIENEHFCCPDASGIGAPHWKSDTGFMCSAKDLKELSPAESRSIFIEALIFRLLEIVSDLAAEGDSILLSGGASHDRVLLEAFTSCCKHEVYLSSIPESTGLGALKIISPQIQLAQPKRIISDNYSYLKDKQQRWNKWFKENCL